MIFDKTCPEVLRLGKSFKVERSLVKPLLPFIILQRWKLEWSRVPGTATRTISSNPKMPKRRKDGRHELTYKGLFTRLDGLKTKIKGT